MANSTTNELTSDTPENSLEETAWDGDGAEIAESASYGISAPISGDNAAEVTGTNKAGEITVSETVALATEIALASIPQITPQGEGNAKAIGNPHIRLRLDDNHLAAVNTDQAQEVLVIPQQRLAVMPNMPTPVMGLLNHRSRIFWVIDLPELFGLTPLDPRSPEYHLAILRVNNKSIGLAVQEVQGVARFSTEVIQSAIDNELSPGLIPYLKGCIPQESEMLLVLDAVAISSYSGYRA